MNTGFVKKQSLGFYLFVLSAILGIIGVALFTNSVSIAEGKFYDGWNQSAMLYMTLSVAAGCLSAIVMHVGKNVPARLVGDVLAVAAAVLVGMVIVSFLWATVEELGIYYGSSLDDGNPAVIAAVGMLIKAMVLEGAALLCALLRLFVKTNKNEK